MTKPFPASQALQRIHVGVKTQRIEDYNMVRTGGIRTSASPSTGPLESRASRKWTAGPHVSTEKWDELYTARSVTTINENRVGEQYAVPRRVIQRSSTLLVLESPRMSLTRDALWHNGL